MSIKKLYFPRASVRILTLITMVSIILGYISNSQAKEFRNNQPIHYAPVPEDNTLSENEDLIDTPPPSIKKHHSLYIRIHGGYAFAEQTGHYIFPSFYFSSSKKGSTGFSGRVAIGYNVMPYVGFEIGAALYHIPQQFGSTQSTASGEHDFTKLMKLKPFYAFDLMLKGTLPLSGHNYVYAEAGAAYLTANMDIMPGVRIFDIKSIDTQKRSVTPGKEWKQYPGAFITPKVAAGTGFLLNKHFALEIEYSYLFKKGDMGVRHGNIWSIGHDTKNGHTRLALKKYMPAVHTISIGLNWYF